MKLFTNTILDKIYSFFFSEKSKKNIENGILVIALICFLIHLFLILISKLNFSSFPYEGELFNDPIVAIYTPFSFILLYEVYLLVYYLPQSFTYYLSKQYEIITLIVFRRFFKDISAIDVNNAEVSIIENMQIFYDLIASLILFGMVYLFKKNVMSKNKENIKINKGLSLFIKQKRIISTVLMPVFFYLSAKSLYNWAITFSPFISISNYPNINQIFFEDFFNLLIFIDVIILLLSFFYKKDFHKIIRNSGFVVSTIIIRLSFSLGGILNLILILSALLTGIIVLKIHNMYENNKLMKLS